MGSECCKPDPINHTQTDGYRFQKHVVENAKISIALAGDADTGKTTAAINYIEKRCVDVEREDVSKYNITENFAEPKEEVEAMCEESDVNLNLVGVAEVSYNVFYCMKFVKE